MMGGGGGEVGTALSPNDHERRETVFFMKKLCIVLAIVGARVISAQVPTPSAAAMNFARRLSGCYRLDDGPWRADSVRAGDISTKDTPLTFELTNQVVTGYDVLQSSKRPMFVVRDPVTHMSQIPFTYWRRVRSSREGILMSEPLPLAGLQLTLTPRARDLRGEVEAFTDAIPIDPREPSTVRRKVYARRIACPVGPVH